VPAFRLRLEGIAVESGGIISDVEVMQPLEIVEHEAGTKANRAPLVKVMVDVSGLASEFPARGEKVAVVMQIVNADFESGIAQMPAQFGRHAVITFGNEIERRSESTASVHFRELTAAIESFVENDAAKAAAIDDMDSYLDGLQKQFVQAIFESHAAGRIDLQVAVQLAVVARFYERIGDHAVNVGERVRFVITGWLPEHHGAQRFRLRVDETGEIPKVVSAPQGETTP